MKKVLVYIGVSLWYAVSSVSAFADVITLDATTVCSAANAGINNGISTADVSGSTSCYGVFSGNLNDNDTIVYQSEVFEQLNKIDGAGSAQGPDIGFEITNPNTTAGTWSFDQGALDGTFLILLKASNQFAVWVFEGAADDLYSGTWEIAFTNRGGNNPDLSHISIYGTEGTGTQVPEPSTVLMMFGAMATLFLRRRKA